MSKYKLLAHTTTRDCPLWPEEFETIDAAVKYAIEMGFNDFLVVQVIDWEAQPHDS